MIVSGSHNQSNSQVALRLASLAESNLRSLGLQAVKELKRAKTEQERNEIANVGLLIARARQAVYPAVHQGAAR